MIWLYLAISGVTAFTVGFYIGEHYGEQRELKRATEMIDRAFSDYQD